MLQEAHAASVVFLDRGGGGGRLGDVPAGGVSTRKIAAITVLRPQGELWLGLSRIRISKDAVSRCGPVLERELSA